MVVRISGGGAITGISQIDVAGAINNTTIVSVPAASITDLGAANSNSLVITGSALIVGLGIAQPGLRRTTRFLGTPTLTHNATSLILLGGSNITVVSGDTADWVSLGDGKWCMFDYSRTTPTADSTPVPNTGVLSGTTGQDYQVGTVAPTTRSAAASNGPLIAGDLWYNATSKTLRVFDATLADWTTGDAATLDGAEKLTNKRISAISIIDRTMNNPVASGTITLDLSTASVFNLTLVGNTTLALSNVPALTDETLSIVVAITQGGTPFTLTWFNTVTWRTTGGVAAPAPAANKTIEYIITSSSAGQYVGRKGAAT